MKRFIFLLIATLFLLGSCQVYQNIDVKSVTVSNIDFVSTTSANISLVAEINNPNDVAILLNSFDGTVLKEYKAFATLALVSPSSIEANTQKKVNISINAHIVDPLSLLSGGLNISTWDVDNFRLTAKLTVGTDKGGKRVFKVKEIPIKNIIKRF
jgi:hypothetical protein